jgi:hypothetical protein
MTHQSAIFVLPSTGSQGVGNLHYRNFGANSLSLALRPTCFLSTLHHGCSPPVEADPRMAQDSVSGCWLGFAGEVITNLQITCASRRT